MTTKEFPFPNLPKDFVLGAATSAAQIEGHAEGDGKGPSIWDAFCATPGKIKDGTNIQVACDHVHRMPQDVERMRWLGLDAYRFAGPVVTERLYEASARTVPAGTYASR